MRFYFPIAKIDAEQRTVWGYASTEALDDQGEIVTREALAAALDDYMRFANIREMHQPSAVGVATSATLDDKGLYVAARIVDDAAWAKVQEGVYKGFSIGGRVKQRDAADRTVITDLALTEISVVDRPANPEATFDCWKADGAGPTGEDETRRESPSGDHTAQRDGDFADPGYQSNRRKRYPLHSEPHIRAAWAYIHRPRNAAKYTPDQVDRIKARIVAAWKEKIDAAGPPLGEGKVAAVETLRKGVGDIGRLAAIILDLDWLQEQLAGEAAMGRDDSPQPARLQALIGELCDLLNELVAEETTELTDGAGASDPVAPQELVAMAAGVPGPALADLLRKSRHRQRGRDVADAGALAKALADNAALWKTVAEIVPRLDRLAKRVEEIAETPLPPLTVARGAASLSKREDGGGAPAGDIVAALAQMSDEERTLALIKASYANPIVPPGYASVMPTRDASNR